MGSPTGGITGSNYRITIIYTKPVAPDVNAYNQIMAIFEPTNSYVDTDAYTGAEGNTVWSDKVVGDDDITSTRAAGATSAKSICSTNVPGWGTIEVPEFFKDTHIPLPLPLAQFLFDDIKNTAPGSAEENTVSFVVHTFEEASFYAGLAREMKDQGFTITLEALDYDG